MILACFKARLNSLETRDGGGQSTTSWWYVATFFYQGFHRTKVTIAVSLSSCTLNILQLATEYRVGRTFGLQRMLLNDDRSTLKWPVSYLPTERGSTYQVRCSQCKKVIINRSLLSLISSTGHSVLPENEDATYFPPPPGTNPESLLGAVILCTLEGSKYVGTVKNIRRDRETFLILWDAVNGGKATASDVRLLPLRASTSNEFQISVQSIRMVLDVINQGSDSQPLRRTVRSFSSS